MYWNITREMSYSDREIPLDIDELLKIITLPQPEDEWQALMEAPPGFDPAPVRQDITELSEIVLDCIDLLLDQDRYIVHAIEYERVSYEELGRRLGCSGPHAWRLKQIAYRNLGEVLEVDGRFRDFWGKHGR